MKFFVIDCLCFLSICGKSFGQFGEGTEDETQDVTQDLTEVVSSHYVLEGKDAIINVSISEDYDVVWQRPAYTEPLQPNAEQKGAALVIHNATKADSGLYVCRILDKSTKDVQRVNYVNLHVAALPRASVRPSTTIVRHGGSLLLVCVVDMDDIVNVTWRGVERPLPSRVEVHGRHLILHQIQVEDAGIYECIADSPYARVSANARVAVRASHSDLLPIIITADYNRNVVNSSTSMSTTTSTSTPTAISTPTTSSTPTAISTPTTSSTPTAISTPTASTPRTATNTLNTSSHTTTVTSTTDVYATGSTDVVSGTDPDSHGAPITLILILVVLFTVSGGVAWYVYIKKKRVIDIKDHYTKPAEEVYDYVPVDVIPFYEARALATANKKIESQSFVPALLPRKSEPDYDCVYSHTTRTHNTSARS